MALGLRKKSPLEKISFLVDWPLSKRAIKCQQASWPEDDVKPIRLLYNFIWSIWFWQGSVCWPPRDSIYLYESQNIYKQTWKIKKWDQFLERLIFLCCFFSFWLNIHLVRGYSPSLLILPGLLRSDRGGLSASSPLGKWKDACDLCRWWWVFHVNQVIQPPFLH